MVRDNKYFYCLHAADNLFCSESMMGLIDKKNILPTADSISKIELELGCGDRKRNRQAIGVDRQDYPDVDIVGDVYEVLASFPTKSVDEIGRASCREKCR